MNSEQHPAAICEVNYHKGTVAVEQPTFRIPTTSGMVKGESPILDASPEALSSALKQAFQQSADMQEYGFILGSVPPRTIIPDRSETYFTLLAQRLHPQGLFT
jgi:hypothetical protein